MKTIHSRLLLPATLSALALCSTLFAQEPITKGSPDGPRNEFKKRPEENGSPERKGDGENEKFGELKRRLQELRQAGRNEEADRLQAGFAAKGKQEGEFKRPPEAQERLLHLQEAIKHLRLAGVQDVAQQLEQMSRQLQAELSQSKGKTPGGEQAAGPEVRREMDQLRGQLQKLTQEVQELRGQAKKQADGERKKE